MFFILFIMHNPDLLEELLDAWKEIGVQRATVFFSTGMRRLHQKEGMRDDIPLMPSLESFYEVPQTFSRTIFTTARDESMIDRILAATERVVGNLNNHETGVLLVLPVIRAHGLEKGKTP
jgi:hypothetical protein